MTAKQKTIFRAVSAYLVVTLIFGLYSRFRHDKILHNHLMLLSGEYLKVPGKFEKDLKEDEELHGHSLLLKLTPPLGWYFHWRNEAVEDRILFLGKNFPLPETQRLADAKQCASYDIDPSKKSDRDLFDEMIATVK